MQATPLRSKPLRNESFQVRELTVHGCIILTTRQFSTLHRQLLAFTDVTLWLASLSFCCIIRELSECYLPLRISATPWTHVADWKQNLFPRVILITVRINVTDFWDVTSYNLLDSCQRIGSSRLFVWVPWKWWQQHSSKHLCPSGKLLGVTSQNAVISLLIILLFRLVYI